MNLSLKKSLRVFIGTVSLDTNRTYLGTYKKVLPYILNQDCPVEMMDPYRTPPYSGKFKFPGKTYLAAITDRLNHIVDRFIRSKASHLWLVDGDNQPPPDALYTLLKLNVDIASGVYPKHGDKDGLMFGEVADINRISYKPWRLEDVRGKIMGENIGVAGGNGCMLIKRRVFIQHHQNVLPLRFTTTGGGGSDLVFWIQAQRIGYSARVHCGVVCSHLPEWSYEEMNP